MDNHEYFSGWRSERMCSSHPYTHSYCIQNSLFIKYSIHIFQRLFHIWVGQKYSSISSLPFLFSLSLNLQESVFLPVKWIQSPAPDKAILSLCINCRQFKGQIVVLPSLCGRVCCHCSLALKRWLNTKTIQMQMKHSERISP